MNGFAALGVLIAPFTIPILLLAIIMTLVGRIGVRTLLAMLLLAAIPWTITAMVLSI